MSEVARIASPDHMGFVSWANSVIVSLKDAPIPSPTSEEKWKEWAASLCAIKSIGTVPSTSHFEKWQDWAYAFMRSVKNKQ